MQVTYTAVVGFVSFLSDVYSSEWTGQKTGKSDLCAFVKSINFQWVKCVLYAGKLQAVESLSLFVKMKKTFF